MEDVFPLTVLYPVHGAGFSWLTFFICLFTICNLLTHLWAWPIYKCVSLFTLLKCSQFWWWRLSDTLTETGKLPLGRHSEFSMWVSNSLMMSFFLEHPQYYHPSVEGTLQWGQRVVPFLILEDTGFWKILHPPISIWRRAGFWMIIDLLICS